MTHICVQKSPIKTYATKIKPTTSAFASEREQSVFAQSEEATFQEKEHPNINRGSFRSITNSFKASWAANTV